MNTKEGFLMAEEELKKSLVLKPQYPQAMATLAETYLRGRDLKADSKHLAEATEPAALSTNLDPKLADGYMVQAYLHDLQGEKEEATKKAMKAIEIRPNDVGSNYFLGSMMIKENREAEAVPYLEKVAKAKPEFVQTHVDLAGIYDKIGDQRSALSQWRILVSLDSAKGEWQCGLADSLIKNDLRDEAVRPFGKCVEIIPDNVNARIKLVGLLLDVKKKHLKPRNILKRCFPVIRIV
jgi:tetratricopeptide (TPR) repeat protein